MTFLDSLKRTDFLKTVFFFQMSMSHRKEFQFENSHCHILRKPVP